MTKKAFEFLDTVDKLGDKYGIEIKSIETLQSIPEEIDEDHKCFSLCDVFFLLYELFTTISFDKIKTSYELSLIESKIALNLVLQSIFSIFINSFSLFYSVNYEEENFYLIKNVLILRFSLTIFFVVVGILVAGFIFLSTFNPCGGGYYDDYRKFIKNKVQKGNFIYVFKLENIGFREVGDLETNIKNIIFYFVFQLVIIMLEFVLTLSLFLFNTKTLSKNNFILNLILISKNFLSVCKIIYQSIIFLYYRISYVTIKNELVVKHLNRQYRMNE